MKDYFGGKFPIGMFCAPPPPLPVNKYDNHVIGAGYKLASDAGFNLAKGLYEFLPDHPEGVALAMEYAARYGMKYLVWDKDFYSGKYDMDSFRARLKQYRSHPAFVGHEVFDEPGRVHFPLLKFAYELYRTVCPDSLFFVNLQPEYSPDYYLANGMWTKPDPQADITYRQYLDGYFDGLKPDMFSCDFYPMVAEAGVVKSGYFRQLSIMAEYSLKYDVPYWVYIQSCTWDSTSRKPNVSEILWQVNTSLSFGAKGMQYFCFFTPYSNPPERYNAAIIDYFGEPTDIFPAVKSANKFAADYSDVFLKSQYLGTAMYGISPDSVKVDNIWLPEHFARVEGNAVVGGFCSGEVYYYLIVNNSIADNMSEIVVYLQGSVTAELIGGWGECVIKGGKVTCNLSGGEAALIAAKGAI